MEILQDHDGETAILAPSGRLDSLAAPLLGSTLQKLDAAGTRRLVIDLARVDYISSAGLGVLFSLAKHMREVGGALAICSLGDQVRRVFDLAGYTPHFQVAASRDAAVALVSGQRA